MKGLIVPHAGRQSADVIGIVLWYPALALAGGVAAVSNQGLAAVLSVGRGIVDACVVMGLCQWWRFRAVVGILRDLPSTDHLEPMGEMAGLTSASAERVGSVVEEKGARAPD